jgi:hypothetical protein
MSLIDDGGHHQRLTFCLILQQKRFAVHKHSKMKLHICISSACTRVEGRGDAMAVTEGGHHTSQRPFPAIASIVITCSRKSL